MLLNLIWLFKVGLLDHGLFSNSLVFCSFFDCLNWYVFDVFFLDDLWDMLCYVFDSIIISNFLLSWNIFYNFLCNIFCDLLSVGNVFNSWLSLDYLSSLLNSCLLCSLGCWNLGYLLKLLSNYGLILGDCCWDTLKLWLILWLKLCCQNPRCCDWILKLWWSLKILAILG